jgi:XTP/dITP diphosphohydrolase
VKKVLKLIFLTNNNHKFREAQRVVKGYGIILIPNNSVPKLEIQSDSLVEVASFGAKFAYQRIKRPLIVDDSGLFIHWLNGFPGVYSSHAFKTLGVGGILRLMDGSINRKAYFETAVSYYDGLVSKNFVAKTAGTVLQKPKGRAGFGFDPIFSPKGSHGKSFAEMTLNEKNCCSHRAKAFRRFASWYMNTRSIRLK